MKIVDRSLRGKLLPWEFVRETDCIAVTLGFQFFGYWSVRHLEILRIGWGLVTLVRVSDVYGLSICGFHVCRLNLRPRALAA